MTTATIDQRTLQPSARTHRTEHCEVCGAWQVELRRSVTEHKLSRIQHISHWACTDQRACRERHAAKRSQVASGVARISDLYAE